MEQLRRNFALRVAAWVLLAVFSASGVLFFIGTMAGGPYLRETDSYSSWQDCQGFRELCYRWNNRLTDAVDAYLKLEHSAAEFTFLERQQMENTILLFRENSQPNQTNYRYRLLSADGSELYGTNCGEDEEFGTLGERVYFALIYQQGESTGNLNIYWDGSYHSVEDTDADVNAQSAYDSSQTGGAEYVLEFTSLSVPGVEDEFYRIWTLTRKVESSYMVWVVLSVALLGCAVLCAVMVLWAAGYTRKSETPVASWHDRVFLEFYLLAIGVCAVLLCVFLAEMEQTLMSYIYNLPGEMWSVNFRIPVGAACLGAAGLALCVVLALRTVTVRLRTHTVVSSTLLLRLGTWFFHTLPVTWRAVVLFLAFSLISLLAIINPYSGELLVLWAVVQGAALAGVCWWCVGFRRIREEGRALAAGNLEQRVDTHLMPPGLKPHGEALNNISQGMAAAVDEQMKSERFKAELITNVSHDLKTPLTSIINYVDLLKTTDQTDPRAEEYISVLDRKSQRLKKLTEDLVEASKASTGVLNVNRERLDLAQLLDQAIGEWEEKLSQRGLTVIRTVPEVETWVTADGRHLWRVIDNLLSNCSKYAMEGTRVYVELVRGKGSASLMVKNISREPLNIPAERLMERFVRGEESRSTEGSGLGLSIARSLTELQGGTFSLTVDGDLFKATVSLPQIS